MRDPDFCYAIQSFRNLGSGHNKREVLIADRRHLTEFATVHRLSRVLHNWRFSTPNQIMLEGLGWRAVHTDTEGDYIVWKDGTPAFLLWPSAYGTHLYKRQTMRQAIIELLNAVDTETMKGAKRPRMRDMW